MCECALRREPLVPARAVIHLERDYPRTEPSMDPGIRQLRHDLRGRANTLLLCTSALPHTTEQSEKLEYLDEIIIAAEKLVGVLDQLEAMPEHFAAGATDTQAPASTVGGQQS
jgi:hypothetical protein